MTVTMKDVREFLDPEEPDYAMASQLGTDALPYLTDLVKGDDVQLASKAAYLAGLIGGPKGVAVLATAAASASPTVRVAAAASIQHAGQVAAATKVTKTLLADHDDGVRKQALRSAASGAIAGVESSVQGLADGDPNERLRGLAAEVSGGLKAAAATKAAATAAAKAAKPAKPKAAKPSAPRPKQS